MTIKYLEGTTRSGYGCMAIVSIGALLYVRRAFLPNTPRCSSEQHEFGKSFGADSNTFHRASTTAGGGRSSAPTRS